MSFRLFSRRTAFTGQPYLKAFCSPNSFGGIDQTRSLFANVGMPLPRRGMWLSEDSRGSHGSRRAFFSTKTSSSGFSLSPFDWWKNRQEKKQGEKYRDRIQSMASKEAWTLGDMLEDLDEALSSWITKVPIIGNNHETAMAKQMQKTVKGLIEVAGSSATGEVVLNLSRTDKLKASLHAETTVEQINLLINQFQTMTLMHRVLRARVETGKPIPTTPDAVQAIMQTDAPKVLTKAHKARLAENQALALKKVSRRRN